VVDLLVFSINEGETLKVVSEFVSTLEEGFQQQQKTLFTSHENNWKPHETLLMVGCRHGGWNLELLARHFLQQPKVICT
jgi:menaquinone-dependent protoporphyrinogen IX oxidase